MTEPIYTVLERYNDPFYSIDLAGLSSDVSVPEFLVLVRTLHAGTLLVELHDAGYGLQLFDPIRKTPVGWIKPNPLRPGGTPASAGRKDKQPSGTQPLKGRACP